MVTSSVVAPIVSGSEADGIRPRAYRVRGEVRIGFSGYPDLGRRRNVEAGGMREALGRQWLKAIDIALAAVEAAARAGAMPADEAAGYRRLLAPERAWVEAFDWSTLDRRASVVVLARRRSPRDNVEKAA